jgi:outer membrane immunogenic protein
MSGNRRGAFMRRSLIVSGLAVGLFIGVGATAFAKPHHPPPPSPPPPPAWSWTGFYTGLNLGYGFGSSNTTVSFFDPTGFLTSSRSRFGVDGVLGGAQAGYNWQVDKWVWGLETDFQGTGQRGTATYICPVTACAAGPFVDSLTQKLDWFGTTRVRVGLVAVPDSLWYVTGGVAYGDIRTRETISGGAPVQPTAFIGFNTVKAGWALGGGYEGHLGGNWTWKIEYLFIDFGNVGGTGVSSIISSGLGFCDTHVCNLGTQVSSTFTDNIVRVGLNYKWQ